MYCVHCGADGAETFCAACGRRQQPDNQLRSGSNVPQSDTGDSEAHCHELAPIAWTESIQYETVLANSEARQRISAAGQKGRKGVTGEDLLAIFDAVSPIGISLEKLTNAILPIYDRMGIKTNRDSQAIFDAPPGRVLLAVLCTLAAKSLTIEKVCQDLNSCAFSAEIPSGLITNRGMLQVLILVEEQCVRVSIGITISGQWYDFGKSKRLIDEMLAAIHGDITTQQMGHPPRYRRVA